MSTKSTRNIGDEFEITGMGEAGSYKYQKGEFGTLIFEPTARGVVATLAGKKINEQDTYFTAVKAAYAEKKRKRGKEFEMLSIFREPESDSLRLKDLKSILLRLKKTKRIAVQYKKFKELPEKSVASDLERYTSGMLVMGEAYLRNTIVVVGNNTTQKELMYPGMGLLLKDVLTEKQYKKKYKEVSVIGENSISVRHWNHEVMEAGDWEEKKSKEKPISHKLGDFCILKKGHKLVCANVLKYDQNLAHDFDLIDKKLGIIEKVENKNGDELVVMDTPHQHRLERELWIPLEYYAPHTFIYVSYSDMNDASQSWLRNHFNSVGMNQDEFTNILKNQDLYAFLKQYKLRMQPQSGLVKQGVGRAEDILTYAVEKFADKVNRGEAEIQNYSRKNFIRKFTGRKGHKYRMKLASPYIRKARLPGLDLGYGIVAAYQYLTKQRN